MNTLIETIILNNSHVRKLNACRNLHNPDPREAPLVSDNKNESHVPTLATFLDIQSALCPPPVMAISGPYVPLSPCSQGHSTIPANPAHSLAGQDSGPMDHVAPIIPSPGYPEWQGLISGGQDATTAPDQPPKNSHVNCQCLGPIYSANDIVKNKHQLDMTDIPNSILQMAYNKLYIPLSMLTTPALSKIHMNDNLKFCKIPFGNGIGKQSLDEASFPSENTLTVTTFLQAYRNWFSIINIIMTPEMVVGWYEHHSRMLRDEKFVGYYFDAWHDMDKQLCTLTAPLISNYWSDPIWIPFWPMLKKPSIPLNYNAQLTLTCPNQLSQKMAVPQHKDMPLMTRRLTREDPLTPL